MTTQKLVNPDIVPFSELVEGSFFHTADSNQNEIHTHFIYRKTAYDPDNHTNALMHIQSLSKPVMVLFKDVDEVARVKQEYYNKEG